MNVKEKVEINGEILKQARESKGYKQDDLAKAIFSTRQSISNWENGKKIPTLENIKRLAEILEIPVDDLIVNNEENESILNDAEELSDNTMIDYTLVYDKNAKSRFKKLNIKKIIKIVALIVLLIFLIYLCSSIRKLIILNDIKNKMIQYESVDNYSYVKTYWIIDVNNNNLVYYTENILYKDGISQTTRYDGEMIESIYDDGKKSLIIDEKNKEYTIAETYGIINSNMLKNLSIELVNTEDFINYLNAFNPFFSIKTMESYYEIEFYNIGSEKRRVIENISADGILKERTTFYANGNYNKVIYETKINSVDNQELEVNLEEYTIKK